MQRIEYEAATRQAQGARKRGATACAGPAPGLGRHVRLTLALALAFATMFWIAGFWITSARAEDAGGPVKDKAPATQQIVPAASSADAAPPASAGATPAAPDQPVQGGSTPSANDGPGGPVGSPNAGAAPANPGLPPAVAAPPAKDEPAQGEESTDEDAATLPEPDDGKPPRGAEGPPPTPRGPSAFAGLPSLLPSPAEAGHIDEVELPKRPVAILSGRSSWDDGFKSLFDSFDAIAAELAKVGVKPVGRPITVFATTDESGFSFEAMTPVDAIPADPSKVGGGVRFGESPSGKAIRFTHKAPYEEIDTTYEAITAYLDAKNITAQDAFIEEYVTDPKDPSDGSLQINIYVQPK